MSKMDVLLSIKPKYANKILREEKEWEFRRSPPTINPPYDMLLYSSSPVQDIIGVVTVDKVVRDNIDTLIRSTIGVGNPDEGTVRKYFEGKREGAALHIESVKNTRRFNMLGDNPPQNFKYIDKENYHLDI